MSPPKIIGDIRSGTYHLPDQSSYHHILKRNRVYFDSEEQAIHAGYHRARH